MKREPLIGVSGPDRGGGASWLFNALNILIAGGRPVRITPSQPRQIDTLNGLILGGGADVNPSLYGEVRPVPELVNEPKEKAHRLRKILDRLLGPLTWLTRKLAEIKVNSKLDKQRDALEMNLLSEAMRIGLPVLGICRGQQLMNVYFGGSLHQTLSIFYTEAPEIRTFRPNKYIKIIEGSILSKIIGEPHTFVNGLHLQGVNQLGKGVHVAAVDKNNIIQAIEYPGPPAMLGVQWHPEYLPQVAEQRAIYAWLVRAARETMS